LGCFTAPQAAQTRDKLRTMRSIEAGLAMQALRSMSASHPLQTCAALLACSHGK
jgi:hypothetical protein